VCVCARACVRARTRMHTHTHTHIYIYIYNFKCYYSSAPVPERVTEKKVTLRYAFPVTRATPTSVLCKNKKDSLGFWCAWQRMFAGPGSCTDYSLHILFVVTHHHELLKFNLRGLYGTVRVDATHICPPPFTRPHNPLLSKVMVMYQVHSLHLYCNI